MRAAARVEFVRHTLIVIGFSYYFKTDDNVIIRLLDKLFMEDTTVGIDNDILYMVYFV